MKNPHIDVFESPCPVILVTGATGFLGGALLARLVERPDVQLIALARSKNGLTPPQRVLHSINRFLPSAMALLPMHLQFVEGDLSAFDDGRFAAVTHVLHAAANTSFRSKRGVWEVNYEGTKRLLSLCERMRRLRRFVYVGTAMACGEQSAGVRSEERALVADAKHIVEYTRSKALTELELIAGSSLSIVTARPSIIVGHGTFGVRPSASIWWFFRAVAALRFHAWSPSTAIDIVPVDWVAEALEVLLLKQHLHSTTYHLSAGLEASDVWSDIDRAFVAAPSTPAPRVASTNDLALVQSELFALFPSVEKTRLAEALSAYYRFAALGLIFSNQRIRSEGVSRPPAFTSLVTRYLETSGARSIDEQMRDDD